MWVVFGFALFASMVLLTQSEFGPILISRPVVLGPLLGATVGHAESGLALGALLEWIWADRVPAGGLRTPAVGVGTAAGLLALWTQVEAARPAAGEFSLAVAVALLYLLLFVPLDGGLRRLWSLAAENVLTALRRGSLAELRIFGPVALGLRILVVALGLTTVVWAADGLRWLVHSTGTGPALAAIPWAFVVPAALAGLVWRNPPRGRISLLLAAFALGWSLTWFR